MKGTECKKKTQERSEKAVLREERQALRAKDPKEKAKDPKEDVTNVEVIITSEIARLDKKGKAKAKHCGRLTRRMYNRDIGALGIRVSFPSSGPAGGLEQREVEKERAFLEAKATTT